MGGEGSELPITRETNPQHEIACCEESMEMISESLPDLNPRDLGLVLAHLRALQLTVERLASIEDERREREDG
jgi:hypothetical protein